MMADRYELMEELLTSLEQLTQRNAYGPSLTPDIDLPQYKHNQEEFNALFLPILSRALKMQGLQIVRPCTMQAGEYHTHHATGGFLMDETTAVPYILIEPACTKDVHSPKLTLNDEPVPAVFDHTDDAARRRQLNTPLDHLSEELRSDLFNYRAALELGDPEVSASNPDLMKTVGSLLHTFAQHVPIVYTHAEGEAPQPEVLDGKEPEEIEDDRPFALFEVRYAGCDDDRVVLYGNLIETSEEKPQLIPRSG